MYVLEVNPRSSRTVPFLSKVTGIPMVDVADESRAWATPWPGWVSTRARCLSNQRVSVKVPVFSFAKLRRVDIDFGPEMKSTGEVMGSAETYAKALYKGLLAAGMDIPMHGTVLATVSDKDKEEALPIFEGFANLGFRIFCYGRHRQVPQATGSDCNGRQQT